MSGSAIATQLDLHAYSRQGCSDPF